MTIVAAADGSALGNPGPAGWAWYVDDERWAAGGWAHGTNNMGELTAVLELLRATEHVDDDLLIYCDSTYTINTITKWMAGWKRRGWRKGDGKPVMNLQIVKALDEAMVGRDVRFEWVKGHAGHELNEAADQRANAAALAFKAGRQPERGPGYAPTSTSGSNDPASASFARSESGYVEEDLLSGLLDPADPAEHDVVRLERSLLDDETRSDPAAVAALLHPDWSEIGASGRLWDRESILGSIGPLSRRTRLEVVEVSEVTPGAVLLIWRAVDEGGSRLRSSLWVRHRGRWVLRFAQGTPEPV